MADVDVVDVAVGLTAGSPLAVLRRQRPEFVRCTQGSHDALIVPPGPGGLSLIERASIALCVATIERDAVLIEHYRALLHGAGGQHTDPPPRLATMLDHVTLVASDPAAATRERLDTLRGAGLTPRDIVAITQIVAFVSYQVRIVAGLRALAEDTLA